MDPQAALDLAKNAEPDNTRSVAPHDPQGLEVGVSVAVSPDVDGVEQPVYGTVVYANAESISIERQTDELGALHVHFPRAGYRVEAA